MNKEEKEALARAWGMSHSIVREIRDLAEMNTMLAYAVIRQAETIIDLIVVNNFDKAIKDAEKDDNARTARAIK